MKIEGRRVSESRDRKQRLSRRQNVVLRGEVHALCPPAGAHKYWNEVSGLNLSIYMSRNNLRKYSVRECF